MKLVGTAAIFGLCIAFTGCVSFQAIDEGMVNLKGRKTSEAFDILGFPDAETMIAGKHVFTWNARQTGSYTVPTYNTTTAYVDGKPVTIRTTGQKTETYDYRCKVKIVANDAGTIEYAEYDGDTEGCERYAERFNAVKK